MSNSVSPHDAGKVWLLGILLGIPVGIASGLLVGEGFVDYFTSAVGTVPYLVAAFIMVRRRGVSVEEAFRLRTAKARDLAFPVAFTINLHCVTVLALVGIDLLTSGGASAIAERVPESFPNAPRSAAFVLAVLVVPIIEELFFRGFLTGAMLQLGAAWALVISSAWFALCHWPGMWPTTFLGSLVSGLFVLKTGSILPAIAAHLTNNLLAEGLSAALDPAGEAVAGGAALGLWIAGALVSLFFIPQYRLLWADLRAGVQELREKPVRQTVKYLFGHWSYKVILALLVLTVAGWVGILSGKIVID